jgi:hypothetical protein
VTDTDDDEGIELRPITDAELRASARAAEAELIRRARALRDLDERGWSGDLTDAEEVDDD